MARNFICDLCQKPTARIVGKLFYTPTGKKDGQYTHHADIGECCDGQLKKAINFRERMSAKQYHESRRRGSH